MRHVYLFTFIFVVAAHAAAADKPVKLADLPTVVQKTMQNHVGATGAKIKRTMVEVENGKKSYECESVLANGQEQDFMVDESGKIGEIEDAIDLTQAPNAVQAKVKQQIAAGSQLKGVVSVTVDGKIVGYEASLMRSGKTRGMEMRPDGSPRKD